MCQFLCHLSIAYDALAYPCHLPVICLIQASKCILVALSPSLYELFYVHRNHSASIDKDTTFPKKTARLQLLFLQVKLCDNQNL